MRPALRLMGLVLVAAGLLAACGRDGVGPEQAVQVTYLFKDTVYWVAAQDGSGPWARVPFTGGGYSFTLHGRGGLAYVTREQSGRYRLWVIYASASEFRDAPQQIWPAPTISSPTRTVHGSVTGLGPNEWALITIGQSGTLVSAAIGLNFTFSRLSVGPVDLLATRLVPNNEGLMVADRFWLQRGLDPADGGTLAPIDFAASAAFAPASRRLDLANLAGDPRTNLIPLLWTAGGSVVTMHPGARLAALDTVRVLPADKLVAGDVLMLILSAANADNTSSRTVKAMFFEPRDLSLSFGPRLAGITVSTMSGRPTLTWQVQAPYDKRWNATFGQLGGDRSAAIYMTGNYAGSSDPVTLASPDFSGVAGWNPAWGPGAGRTDWSLSVNGWTGTSSTNALVNPQPSVGQTYWEARTTGQLTQ